MRPNFFKLIITYPYLLNAIRKSRSYFKKIISDPLLVSEEKRYIWVKRIAKYILWLHNTKIHTLNKNNWIDGPVFIASNHQSNMDGAILFVLNNFKETAPCAFIAKQELKKSKKLYKFLSLIDVIFIDRNNLRQQVKAFNYANEIIKVPRSMVIFPEGTRNPDNKTLLDFKDGAFKLAQKAYVPIVPVTIYDSHNALSGSRTKRKNIYVIFHQPIMPINFIHMTTEGISTKVKKIIQSGLDNIEDLKNEIKLQKIKSKKNKKNNSNAYKNISNLKPKY